MLTDQSTHFVCSQASKLTHIERVTHMYIWTDTRAQGHTDQGTHACEDGLGHTRYDVSHCHTNAIYGFIFLRQMYSS